MAAKQYGYVNSEYLAAAAELFDPIKKRSYQLMGDLAGKSVLDIGCGSGLDTLALARLVGDSGFVHGVDFDAEMIHCADERIEQTATEQSLRHRVKHQCADAYHLPFQADEFFATRSERLFMHLSDPQLALAEAVRVTQPGGRLVIVDTDWGSVSAHTGADAIERRLADFRAEVFIPNGYSGRRLAALMSDANLGNIHTETVALHTRDLELWRFLTLAQSVADLAVEHGVVDSDELVEWDRAMQRTSKTSAFFGSVNVVLACATVIP